MGGWTGKALEQEVRDAAGGSVELVSHEQRDWAAGLYDGTRHELFLRWQGERFVEEGEAFLAALEEWEPLLPGRRLVEARRLAIARRFKPHLLQATILVKLVEDLG